jgi:PhoPQ-activated pathogenicity-related protein
MARAAHLGLLLLAASPHWARADLAGYVGRADPAFAWSLKGKSATPLGTVYDLHLVSQVWQGIKWEHELQIYVPPGVAPTATVFLWNQGGSPGANSAAFGLTLAARIKAPVAFLFNIPNQPLLDGLKEDALIAETFVRCLDTGDDNWPLLFAMVKGVVRAMDAVQAFAEAEWPTRVTGFVVSGASKRGWTAWLTAAADRRVTALAPLVIDMLNLPEQLPHQVASFGGYSAMIGDYTRRGLVPLPKTEAARRLWQMADPYSYRERLTQPKLILNGANDPYWTADALNLYWDGLKGDKWVHYVPNAGHNLTQALPDGKKDRARSIDVLTAFARAQVHGKPFPRLSWTHVEADGATRVTARSTAAAKSARLWVADLPLSDQAKAGSARPT